MKKLVVMTIFFANFLMAMNSNRNSKPVDIDAAIKAFDLCERTCILIGSVSEECTAKCWADYNSKVHTIKEGENSEAPTKK